MRNLRSPTLVLGLVVLLLVVGGILSAQAIGHVSQHTHHHTSATHATTLCSWYCAAGQVHGADLVVVAAPIASFLAIQIERPVTYLSSIIVLSSSRAPPSV